MEKGSRVNSTKGVRFASELSALPLHYYCCKHSSVFRNFVWPNQTSVGGVSVAK